MTNKSYIFTDFIKGKKSVGSYILDQKKGFYSFFLDMMRIGNFSKVNIWTK